jgi:hypothetical protein
MGAQVDESHNGIVTLLLGGGKVKPRTDTAPVPPIQAVELPDSCQVSQKHFFLFRVRKRGRNLVSLDEIILHFLLVAGYCLSPGQCLKGSPAIIWLHSLAAGGFQT